MPNVDFYVEKAREGGNNSSLMAQLAIVNAIQELTESINSIRSLLEDKL